MIDVTKERLDALEKKIRELEARPQILILPTPVYVQPAPFQPVNPFYPWYQLQITCTAGVSTTWTPASGTTR